MTLTQLVAPVVQVTMADGATWTVQTGNPDLIAWDVTAAKQKWPPVKDAPFLWLTFLAWHASRRKQLGPDPSMTWETFRATAENIVGPDDDESEDGMTVVDPTGVAPVPG